jgi:hypothetical protein
MRSIGPEIPLVDREPIEIEFSEKRVSKSSSRIAHKKPFSRKCNLYWFSVNQWDFGANGPHIWTPQLKLPLNSRFSEKWISIGCQSTNGISRQMDLIFQLPSSNYPKRAVFLKTWILLVLGQPMGFRGKWTSNLNSPARITSEVSFSLVSTTFRWVDTKWFPLIEITRNHQKSLEIKKSEISLFSLGFYSTPFCSTNISVSRTLKLFFLEPIIVLK